MKILSTNLRSPSFDMRTPDRRTRSVQARDVNCAPPGGVHELGRIEFVEDLVQHINATVGLQRVRNAPSRQSMIAVRCSKARLSCGCNVRPTIVALVDSDQCGSWRSRHGLKNSGRMSNL